MRRAPQRFDGDLLEGARADVGIFAEALIGERLWKHQLEVARSPERVRVVNSGRQAGKSRTLAVLALHEAYSGPERRVLVLSAGEDAAKELLRHVGGLCSSPLLAGSVVDENASVVRLSNGSEIRSVPASEKQVRGRSVDLLILDEAAFIDDAIWTAARFTVIARPGSRVVMASTPYGRTDRFFSIAYRAGERKEQGYCSFHWPSTVSPMVDREWLALQRKTMTDREYRAEVLAEWVDDSGAYFSSAELEGAVEDYELVDPSVAMGTIVSGGVDWGLGDANALALVGRPRRSSPGFTLLATGRPGYEPQERPKDPLRVLWLEEHFGMPYGRFIDRIVDVGTSPRGYRYGRLAAESNGVGQMPVEVLRGHLAKAGAMFSSTPSTPMPGRRRTGSAPSKLLLQQGDLKLPRHPALLGQLAALEYETSDTGLVRIAVPERAGHDDLAMALMLAVSPEGNRDAQSPGSGIGKYRNLGRRRR